MHLLVIMHIGKQILMELLHTYVSRNSLVDSSVTTTTISIGNVKDDTVYSFIREI